MKSTDQVQCGAIDAHLGHRIRIARALKNITHTELSLKIGVSPMDIIEYENGTQRIGSYRLSLIAQILDINNQWLFDGFLEDVFGYVSTAYQNNAIKH